MHSVQEAAHSQHTATNCANNSAGVIYEKCYEFIKLVGSYKASRECERTKKGKYIKKYEIRFM